MSIKANYPTVRPSLNLDFANTKRLDPRVTFSRASTATYVDANGVIQTAAANTPRFDHDPSTGESLGLLVEESRTNLLTYSEQFDNAAWSKSTTTVTANTAIAPDGNTTADTLSATSSNATVKQAVSTSAVAMTFSVFLKRKTGTGNIDISADGLTWVTQSISSTWSRYVVTQTAVAGTSNPGIRITTNGDEVYAWGAQFE